MNYPIAAKAIEIIEHGWNKGAYAEDAYGNPIALCEIQNGARGDCYCLVGAIEQARIDLALGPAEYKEILTKLHELIGAESDPDRNEFYVTECDIIDWNDDVERTKEEVVALLKKANEDV